VASAGCGLGERCWCRRVQVTLAACASPDVPAGTVPELPGESWGFSPPAPRCPGCWDPRGEGRQNQGRGAVSQGGSWSGSAASAGEGVRCSGEQIYTTVSSALNKRFPLGGFYGEVQRAVKSLAQFPIVAALFLVISTL